MARMTPAPSRRRPRRDGVSPYRWRLTALGLVLVALVVALQVFSSHDPSRNTALTRVNAVWYDLRFQLLPPQREARIPIVIVDLDEATQQREGRWPWDRRKVAQLIQSLQQHGAALIGFDVVFSEPGANPVRQVLDAADLPTPIDRALTFLVDEFDGDAALGRALSDSTVLGYFFHADGGKAGALPLPFLELPDDALASSTLIAMPDYTANLAVLTDNAWASGFVVAVPDADGIVRRMPLVMRHENGVYTSLGLEMARLAVGAPWVRLDQAQRGAQTVVTGVRVGQGLRIPLDERGNMLVPYRGRSGSYTTVSATGVMQGDAPADQLAALDGALVLVGTSALGLSDLRTIPLQTGFPGVEVHANVIDTILHAATQPGAATASSGRVESTSSASSGLASRLFSTSSALMPSAASERSPFYLRPDWEPGASLILLLVSGLVLALGLPGRSPSMMLMLATTWLLLVIGANLLLWQFWHLALPLALQLVMVVSVGALNIAGGYVATNRQKRAIQTLFGEYVPADHVERMLADPKQISLEGEQRNMTVLFADVRNFTALSESLSASELKTTLNRYLSAITAVIFEHHGTIDKYVGDLVMAFWNAPLDDTDHAEHAVQAALAMQERMARLREEFAAEGLPAFHIGIGINTGPMNVGDMGSTYRRAYTVLGDAVNLASRLEGLTDFYGVPILVSDSTCEQTPNFVYRTVDRVRVKGRRQALTISQPVTSSDEDLENHERAVTAYRDRQWDRARTLFQDLAHRNPDDKLYRLYLDRMADTDSHTLDAQWCAIHEHETKQ